MGEFISGAVGFFSSIVTSIVNTVKALFTLNFMALLFEPLRPICYLLGITDRDITNGSASLVKIFHKSEFPDTRSRLIAEKARNDTGLLDMYWGYSYTGQNQYDKYFYYAQSNFMDHLPEGNIGSSGIDGTVVINALKDDLGLTKVHVSAIDFGIPSNYVWAQWYLQEHNNYKFSTNIVTIDNISYELVNAIYDMDRNKVVAYLTAISTITELIVDRTTITIEFLDSINDKRTTVITRETTTFSDSGEISFNSIVLSTTVDNVLKDTEENSETITTVSETTHTVNNPNIQIDIDPPQHENFYQVVYSHNGQGNKLWLYAVSDTTYNLANPDKKIEQKIDLFPIVALRNSKIDVNHVDSNSSCSVSFKREGRYAQSKEMLQQIGIPIDKLIEEYNKNDSINDVYDVFFVVGISPQQTKDDETEDKLGNPFSRQCVAKLLYETVSYVYRCLPCVQSGQTYYVTFSEEPFKGGVYWAGVPPVRKTGKACDLYDVSMDISSVKLSKVQVKKITRLVKAQNYYSDSNYYYTPNNQQKIYIYHYDLYDVQIEGKITGKSIYDALTGIESTGEGEIRLTEELDSLPKYQVVTRTSSIGYYSDNDDYSGETYSSIFLDITNDSTEISNAYTVNSVNVDILNLDYQLSTTEYRRITLRDMHSLAFTDEVGQGLVSVSKVSEKGFFMPLAVKSLEQLNLYDKNKLISEAFYMMFFAKKTTHLYFYQTKEFSDFIKIIGICIIIIVQIFTWWTGPATSVTLTAVLMAVLKMVVIAIALTLAIHLIQTFVKDPALKMALTAVAMIAAMYAGGGFENIDFSTVLQLVEIPCKMIEMYVGDQMKALQQEYGEFQSGAERTMQEMTEKKAALDTGLETEDIVQLQSATRMAGIPSISIDSWFFLSTNITPVDYVYDQYNQIYDYDSKFDLAF